MVQFWTVKIHLNTFLAMGFLLLCFFNFLLKKGQPEIYFSFTLFVPTKFSLLPFLLHRVWTFMLWWFSRWVQQFYSKICNQHTVPWPFFFSKRRVVLSSQHVSSHWPENYEGLALTSKKPIKQGRPNWKGWMALKFWLQEENIETNKQYLTLKIEDLPPSL